MQAFRLSVFVFSLGVCLLAHSADGQIVEKQWQSLAAFPDVINVIYFMDLPGPPRIGFAGSQGMIYRTSDGGATWNTTVADNYNFQAWDIVFKDSLIGWFANWIENSGSLQCYKTTDGGLTWKAMVAPVLIATSIFYNRTDKLLFISGWGNNHDGALCSSSDDGATWTILPNQGDFNGFAFLNPDSGLITHAHTNVNDHRTLDGGQSWAAIDSDANETFQPLADTFRNVFWAASETGSGYPASNHISILFESFNSGESFKVVDTIPSITGTMREGSCGILYLQTSDHSPDSVKGILQSQDGIVWSPLRDSNGNSGPFNSLDTRFFVAGTYIFAAGTTPKNDSICIWRYVEDSTKYGGTVFTAPVASTKHFDMISTNCNNLDSTVYIDYQNDCIPAEIESAHLEDSSRFLLHPPGTLPAQVSGYYSLSIEHIPLNRSPDSTVLYLQYFANGKYLFDTVYVTAEIIGGDIIAPFDILANGSKSAPVSAGDTVDFRILLTDSLAQAGLDSVRFQMSFDGDVLSFQSARAISPWMLSSETHSEGVENLSVSLSNTHPALANSPIADIFYTGNISKNSSTKYLITDLYLNATEFAGCAGPAGLPMPPVVTISACGDTLLRQVISGQPIIRLLGIDSYVGGVSVSFRTAEAGPVEITLCDMLGRELRTLYIEARAGIDESVKLPVSGLPEGIYFVSIAAAGSERVSTGILTGER